MSSINLINDIQKISIDKPDHMLGKGLQMPFAASNSGSRKLMFGTQLEHRLPLLNPEVAFIQTGYEKEFGINSSSYITADKDITVIGIAPKFSWLPKHQYFVLFVNEEEKLIKVYERKEYKHVTEKYGYLFNNDVLDNLNIGDTIKKDHVIQKSTSFDKYDNRMDGCNLLTLYTASEETMEDAIVISESASKKLASPLVKKVNIVINDNDIPLNLYGNSEFYKVFPDIGEESLNSILCAFRIEKKEESLYSQSYARLRELNISDEKYTASGRVVDIDIYCNAPDRLDNFIYNNQLKRYYDEHIRMSQNIIDIINPYLENGYTMDYECQKLYSDCKGALNGKQYFSEKVFSNIILEITLIEEIPVHHGDKLSNRYGGKGITASVKPDYLMPKTDTGETIEVILNMCGVYGRENAGQLFEITVSHVCLKMIQMFKTRVFDVEQCIGMYLTLLKIVSPSMCKYTEEYINNLDDDECIAFISEVISNDRSIYLAIEPMSENMTIDKVQELYNEFPWAKPTNMYMPVKDSSGNIRYALSRRPLVYGYQYIYRLKQYAKEKFSVTSLSATNIRNENSKSKNSNNYKALYSRTPIRFGDMETGNLIHLGAELVVQMLMLYSTSPHARRLTDRLLTGDAFDIDIKIDENSRNRNVEILNVYLKTMGLKLVFKRIPKKLIRPLDFTPFYIIKDPKEDFEPFYNIHPDENFDIEKEIKRHENEKGNIYPLEFSPFIYLDDDLD